MKSKLVLLVSMAALTFSSISAMASARLPNATKASSSAAISHTVNRLGASARLGNATKGSSSAPISHTVNGKKK